MHRSPKVATGSGASRQCRPPALHGVSDVAGVLRHPITVPVIHQRHSHGHRLWRESRRRLPWWHGHPVIRIPVASQEEAPVRGVLLHDGLALMNGAPERRVSGCPQLPRRPRRWVRRRTRRTSRHRRHPRLSWRCRQQHRRSWLRLGHRQYRHHRCLELRHWPRRRTCCHRWRHPGRTRRSLHIRHRHSREGPETGGGRGRPGCRSPETTMCVEHSRHHLAVPAVRLQGSSPSTQRRSVYVLDQGDRHRS